MEENQSDRPDLLARMLGNRFFRNLLAVAMFFSVLEVYYGAAKEFYRGFQEGRQAAISSGSDAKSK